MTPERDRFAGPWFDAKTAAAYIPCTSKRGGISMKAWHAWKRRHGIIARNNGSVLKADLDRVLRRRKPRRPMHAHSLANLKHQPTPMAAAS
jgi:hypothetical protein